MNLKSRTEILWLLLVFSVAAALRFWNFSNLGLTHFDEGSYANTGRWLATFGTEGWRYQSGHAPGLFPTLVGLFFLIFGISDSVAILASAIAGALTVVLIYLIGLRWFDRKTGLISALFLATSEFHLIFSRMALTDATFALFFWAAVASYFRAFQSKERRWFVLAGVLTGLCWNTKYHGFLPIVFAGLFMLTAYLMSFWKNLFNKQHSSAFPARFPLNDTVYNFGFSALLAVLLFLPWFLGVHFSVGLKAVFGHLFEHSIGAGNLVVTEPGVVWFFLKSWLSKTFLLGATLGVILVFVKSNRGQIYFTLATIFMLVLTLFYAGFPRLLLPAIPGLALLAALPIAKIWDRKKSGAIFASVLLLASIVDNMSGSWPTLKMKTTAYRKAGEMLKNSDGPILTQMSKNFYFYADPDWLEIRWQQESKLDSLLNEKNAVLAVDPIIKRFPELNRWFEKQRPWLELVEEIPIEMYPTNDYQGIDPRLPTEEIPLSRSPFKIGKSKIRIYRKKVAQ